jgi:hypothetical protein
MKKTKAPKSKSVNESSTDLMQAAWPANKDKVQSEVVSYALSLGWSVTVMNHRETSYNPKTPHFLFSPDSGFDEDQDLHFLSLTSSEEWQWNVMRKELEKFHAAKVAEEEKAELRRTTLASLTQEQREALGYK